MKSVVITGAASFLGQATVARMLSAGWKVYAFVRETSARIRLLPKDENLKFIYGSLDTVETLEAEVKNADAFIHYAWDGSGDAGRQMADIQQKNVDYAMRALKTAQALGCRSFIFSGSQSEYGICHGKIIEDNECAPVSEHGKAKLEFSRQAEIYCSDKNMRFVHMRIFSVYGPHDRTGTLTDLCTKSFALGKKVSLGPCLQKWNYLYIDDYAEIVYRLCESDKAEGIINVAGNDTRILREFVEEIYETAGRQGGYDFENTVIKPEGVPQLDPSIEKLEAIVGRVDFTPFREGIKAILSK